MPRIVGIDLGTTYSAIAYFDQGKGTPVIIPNLRGKLTTPSVVFMNEKGEAVVGEAAKRNQAVDATNTIIEVKRKMGEVEFRKGPDGKFLCDAKEEKLEFAVRVPLRGNAFLPQEISAFILRDLKLAAEKFFGEPVHDAVITVPAYFLAAQKNATKEAGQLAGFNVHRLVSEPTAAAIAYGLDKVKGKKQIFAVYDLGGGTFDVSIIEVSKGDIEVLGTGGNPRLGGVDFDDKIVEWILRKISEEHHVNLSGDEGVKRRIKDVAEPAKIELSTANVTTINIPFVALVNNQPLAVSFSLDRSDFEDMIMPRLRLSLECLDVAIASASKEKGIKKEEIDAVLLVGGSTRIPMIRTLLERHLGKPVKADLNPDEVVAMGAAIVSSSLTPIGKSPDLVEAMGDAKPESQPALEGGKGPIVFDVTGHSLGIRMLGLAEGQGDFYPIIRKEATIPTRGKNNDVVSNATDFTTEVLIEVFQGEDIWAGRNTRIGEVKLDKLDPLETGKHKFEVMFILDSSEVLTVEAKDLRTGREVRAVLEYKGGTKMSSDEIARARARIASASPGGEKGEVVDTITPTKAGSEIPDNFKGYYKKARALAGSLPLDRGAALNEACAELMRSVEAGDPAAINRAGEKLQLAYWDAQV